MRRYKRVLNKITKNKRLKTVKFQGFLLGGDKRDRTADLLNAIQALSQLSYTPIFDCDVPSQERYLLYQKI